MLEPEDHEPDVGPFQFYMDAFYELSSCRINSMSVGPIPFTAIVEYSRLYGVEDVEDFHYIIRQMDNVFLKLESSKSKKAETQPNANGNKVGKKNRN